MAGSVKISRCQDSRPEAKHGSCPAPVGAENCVFTIPTGWNYWLKISPG